MMQLTTDLRFGGTERAIVNLVRCLRERGVECAVAGLFEGGESPARMRVILEGDGFEVCSVGLERKHMLWRLSRLQSFIRDWRPEVLHCHLFHSHAAGALLRVLGVTSPMLWTHHSVYRRALWHRTAFYRLFSPFARCHAFVSAAVRGFQHARAGTAPWEEVIYNGIELGPYLAVEPRAGPAFGALGRLAPEKGFDVLIRAFGLLAREKREVHLTIGGAGPARPALEQLMRVEGLSGRLEFAGFVRNVPAFLAGVNVFVLPSRWEAFGMALLEAMAAGLPCIASRVGGMPEVGGDLVRWVEPDDVEGLYKAMREMCSAPQSWLQIARQREAAARFSQDAMADGYLRIYRSMLC